MNKREAQAKLRNHLKTKGNHSCIINERMVTIWWNIINAAVFGGKLHKPIKFNFINMHGQTQGLCKSFGRAERGHVVITLRREYDERITFLTVLAHEMVHQYQWQKSHDMNHGDTFYGWERRVTTATGLPLNEYV